MIRTISRIMAVCLLVAAAVPALGQTSGRKSETIVLGREITPKDTTKQRRFTNRLIAPKGEWQCGLSAKASMLRISPEAAYTFKDNHAVGVRFNYTKLAGILDSATADLLGNLSLSVADINATSNSMGGSVFQRTYVGIDRQGRFGIFWDYILGYTRAKTRFAAGGESSSYTIKQKVNLAFAPGVVYFPMNNVSIQANISIADLSYAATTAYENGNAVGSHKGWKAQAGLNLLNLSFGLTIHF